MYVSHLKRPYIYYTSETRSVPHEVANVLLTDANGPSVFAVGTVVFADPSVGAVDECSLFSSAFQVVKVDTTEP